MRPYAYGLSLLVFGLVSWQSARNETWGNLVAMNLIVRIWDLLSVLRCIVNRRVLSFLSIFMYEPGEQCEHSQLIDYLASKNI